jgi:ABC-type amino acid transport substrate-binding protein
VNLLATFLLVLLSAVCQCAAAQPVALRTTAQEGSAPKYVDTDGTVSGHCPDILAAIERVDKGLRFSIDPRPTPLKRIEAELKDGKLDVICALLDTPLRNEIATRIATPLYTVQERLVGRKDDTGNIQSVQDLARSGDLVVTQSGASYAADLRHNGVQVMETPGGSVIALRNVANRRARFYYTNELTGAYYIKAGGMVDQLRLHPGVMQSSLSYLWASRHLDAATVNRLELAVAQLKRSGELDRIYLNYQKDQ